MRFLLILTLLAGGALAEEEEPQAPPIPPDATKASFSASFTPMFQLQTDIEEGGQFSVARYLFRFEVMKPLSMTTRIGFSVDYDRFDYDFSSTTSLEGAAPWGDINRFSFALPIIHAPSREWVFVFSPSLEFVSEEGADLIDGTVYGAALTATHTFSPTFKLGGGVAGFRRLEKTWVFPFLSLDWAITEKLRLTNPLRVGPTGPAGLELSYSLEHDWVLGAGGAYRDVRFRLDDEGAAPDGVGQESAIPAWLRVSKEFGERFSIDLYAGYAFAGNLRLEDRVGERFASKDYDSAPFLALSFQGRF